MLARQPLREVHDERSAVLAQRVERGGERARRVHDDEVALVEERGQVVRVRVHEAEVVAVRHHHAHRVACDAARFGRLGRFADDQRACHDATGSLRSAAR